MLSSFYQSRNISEGVKETMKEVRMTQTNKMDVEELLYGFMMLLIGVIAFMFGNRAPATKHDPFLLKISQYGLGVVSLLIALYLIVKAII
jgi:hypothetical protein